jgi:PAS domain S-box-containing protein
MTKGKRLLGTVFLIAAALLVGSMVAMYRTGLILIRAEQKTARQLQVLGHVGDFGSTLKGAETDQRGFLLTGDDRYLNLYKTASSQLASRLHSLEQLAVRGDLSTESVQRVAALTDGALAEMDKAIKIRRDQGIEAVLPVLRNEKGQQLMDSIRTELAGIRAHEEREFAEVSQQARSAGTMRSTTYLGAASLNLAFLGWMFARISTEMRRRQAVALQMSRQKELLATTLASIGDAVIVTDPDARLTFLNAEAERLTGWSNRESQGQPLSAVFRLLNEDTRQPAENPIEEARRLGTAVGLSNHTLLVARNGRETPIDDSAAPILQPGGLLFGFVLVFRDYTQQREAQRIMSRSKDELEHLVEERTSKLKEMVAELEHVSYAIVHDMRAPLRAMQGFAQSFRSRTAFPSCSETKPC